MKQGSRSEHGPQLQALSRRGIFLAAFGLGVSCRACPALATVDPVTIQRALQPDQKTYDPTDPDLREAARLLQSALNAATVQEEEEIWTKIVNEYGGLDRNWVPDLVGRAVSNRGNARSRQGKLEEAIDDYNRAIQLCPWSTDPVLNRGAVLEQLGRFEEAERDYKAILEVEPNNAAAWNNLGNTNAGMGNWEAAVEYFGKGASLSPFFSFASANHAVALFQVGRTNEAVREMRSLLRKYPEFPDARAALTASLWYLGKEADAENNWQRVSDVRYKDIKWLEQDRRWPPKLIDALRAFLSLKSIA